MKVLIVDDDKDFTQLLRMALDQNKIESVGTHNGEEAAIALEGDQGFELILLDIEMPGVTGWDLLTNLREAGNDVPVIFISGLEDPETRVRGLRMGADDYLVKPVNYEELVARMEAVLRRRSAMPQVVFGEIRLDLALRRAYRNEKPAHLSPKEFDLLLALTQAKGEVISRADLLDQVWDMPFDPGTNLLDVHIGRLRKKIDRGNSNLICTERGRGYRVATRVEQA